MRWPWWMPRRENDAEEREHGKPGIVFDRDGAEVLGPDGTPLQKVLVVSRRDRMGDATERVWVDPRIAWQWDESTWEEDRHGA